jgi:hypothetical protein
VDSNRSLDISELMSRIHKQAVLVGGPHDGKRAPLPPVIWGDEHPRYLCQPGRHHDQTYYHYNLAGDTTYVYVDHCDTLPNFAHRPDEIAEEEERQAGTRMLFLACLAIVVGFTAIIAGLFLRELISWVIA